MWWKQILWLKRQYFGGFTALLYLISGKVSEIKLSLGMLTFFPFFQKKVSGGRLTVGSNLTYLLIHQIQEKLVDYQVSQTLATKQLPRKGSVSIVRLKDRWVNLDESQISKTFELGYDSFNARTFQYHFLSSCSFLPSKLVAEAKVK